MDRNGSNADKNRRCDLLRAFCLLLLAFTVWSGQKQYEIEEANGQAVWAAAFFREEGAEHVIDSLGIRLINVEETGASETEETGAAEAGAAGPRERTGALYKGKLALTFDDGPDPRYTPKLLDGLAERGVRASFFLTGENAEKYPELVERMQEEGHLIGNHTYSHLQLTRDNREQFRGELVRTNGIIKEITGEEAVYVRPPYGSWDKSFEDELNMFPVLWNIDPLDWCTSNASAVVDRVLSRIKENAVILMHDEYASTVSAALRIVDVLQEEGYEFVTVDEILFD